MKLILLLLPILLISCSKISETSSGTVTNEKFGVSYSITAPKEIIVNDTYTIDQEIKNGSEKR